MRISLSPSAAAIVLLAWTAVSGQVWAAPGFLTAIADLPLSPGLAERIEDGVVFENRAGRIVRASAVGRISESAARRFYRIALPELGWAPAGADRFVREGEMLRLEFALNDGRLTVRFTLAPHDETSRETGPP